ncbi:transcriptional antiterminator [Enterococcus florum]|uniref:Ascorbate-specific PTS system EIIA component n=1 Tax=Enterococcus florum TaxID=2480627 RepID=A0A4V0WPI2_9ENTE|nr:BglG family transcription antiterminator [Enterococcus florum]GCF93949.1 transcriptional antiterminator [Enterococcus florum]
MKEMEIQIIQECMQQQRINLKEFTTQYELESGKFEAALRSINCLLETNLVIDEKQVFVSEKDREKCYRYLKGSRIKLNAYFDVFNRRNLLYLHLIFSELDLNLQELADLLLVSKNTALADIKRLKKELEAKEIYVKYSRKTGYYLFGSEFHLRNELLNVLKLLLTKPYGRYLLLDTGYIQQNELLLLRNRLINIQQKARITFTEESIEELPILLSLLIKRAQRYKQNWHLPFEKYDLSNTKEYPIYMDIFRGFEELNDYDRLYMVIQILSATFVETNHDVFENSEVNIENAIDHFVTFLEDDCVMQFKNREELKSKLLLHLRPAVFRCLLNVNIRNPLTHVLRQEYRMLYSKINEGVPIIEAEAGCRFPEEEIAFIAMIVISSMQGVNQTEKQKTFSAMVLCRSGMSISKMLLETLKQLFPNIKFIGAYAISEVAKSSVKPDFLFTTVPIHSEVTTFLIPPFLDKRAKEEIKQKVNLAINQDVKKKTKELYSFLDDLFPDGHKGDAIERIERFYQKDQEELEVQENYFQLDQKNFSYSHADNWEEVFQQAFDALKNRESITADYIKEVHRIFQQDYQYMMIAPCTYLPHAKPEYGVLRPDYQITLLKQPVHLPNGDHMKMMIALAPSVENQHVEWLLKMNHVLLTDDVLKKQKEVSSAEAFYQLLTYAFEHNDYFKEVSEC